MRVTPPPERLAERYWGDWQGPAAYSVLPRGRPLAPTAAAATAVEAFGQADPRPEVGPALKT